MALLILLGATMVSSFLGSPGPAEFSGSLKMKVDVCQCLPQGIASADIVSAEEVRSGALRKTRKVTVAAKLKELRARCRRGKLVDARGKEIRFYRLRGCWGNPPEDYQEILAQQAKDLAGLRKRYRVIEMTCNPAGQEIAQVVRLRVNKQKPDGDTKRVSADYADSTD